MRYILLLFLFYIWGNWGTDRVSNVSKLIECQSHRFLLWSDDTAHIHAHCKAAPTYIYVPYAALSNKKLFSSTAVTDAGLTWSKEDTERAVRVREGRLWTETDPGKMGSNDRLWDRGGERVERRQTEGWQAQGFVYYRVVRWGWGCAEMKVDRENGKRVKRTLPARWRVHDWPLCQMRPLRSGTLCPTVAGIH